MAFEPLTKEQFQKATQSGFTTDRIIQNELQRKKENTPVRQWWGEVLPTAGAIGGGIIGTAIGGLPGGIAGAGLGAAAGETAQQGVEKAIGIRKGLDAQDIIKTGVEYSSLEAVGGPILSTTGKALKATGRKLVETFIPTTMREAGLLQAYRAGKSFWQRVLSGLSGKVEGPTTAGRTVFEKGLMGT